MKKTIPPVDVKQLKTAFTLYLDAYQGKTHNPGTATDWPLSRAMFALKDFAGKDFFSVAARIWGLFDVLRANKKRVLDHSGFPSEWLDTAATAPLKTWGKFSVVHFVWRAPKETNRARERRARKTKTALFIVRETSNAVN